ncbi:leucine-rich repeat domain-containing protein [Neotamlana laminarinivorans]|uniref:Leucine-rich repeat domain-containing protein n=1 Tax=Neotamlana laminarinivorans TaxID=2883124 RepID=A0A9X1I1S3_9FLAO|nr:leucine-rich repeat domain-containing protein [Tamlana laminarinivorans]MCB4799656.1 leucine-rich repeat domain-containing protein [Tamlana laminarinivorans]
MKKTLLFVFAIMVTTTLCAQTVGDTFTDGDLNYEVLSVGTPNTVTLTGGGGAVVTVPTTVTDGTYTYEVVEVNNNAFKDNATLTNITLPSTVTTLKNGAFRNADNLVSTNYSSVLVTEANSLSRNASFDGLSIDLSSATEINGYTFWESYIAEVDIASAITIHDNAFRRTALTYIKIPETVTSIGSVAFSDTNIAAVEVYWNDAGSLPTIANDAFSGLTITLYVPVGTTSIYENAAVWQDFTIVEGTIPENLGVTFTEGDYNFIITGADTATLTGTNSTTETLHIIPGSAAYSGDAYTITAIADKAFYQNLSVASVSLPTSVKIMGNEVFFQCYSLASINTENIEYIGSNAFRETIITSLDLSEVKSIASNGLGRMAKLTGNLNLPKIEILGAYAFVGPDAADGTHITGLNLGSSLTEVDTNSFYRLRDLSLLTVGTDTPPALAAGATAFDLNTTPSSGLVSDISLEVPTPTGVSNYSMADGWSQFTNISDNSSLSTDNIYVNSLGFAIYPNPATQVISIKNTEGLNAQIKVSDLNGRILISKNINNDLSKINISSLNAGMYLFKITTQGREFVMRIVKQ